MKTILAALVAAAMSNAAPAQAQPQRSPAPASIELWRLDCGDFVMKRYGAWFSDCRHSLNRQSDIIR